MAKIFGKHFSIYIFKTYNNADFNLLVYKKFMQFSYLRNFLKRIFYYVFHRLKLIFYGYNIYIELNKFLNCNRYYKPIKRKLFYLLLEISFLLKKIRFIIN